MRGDEQRVVDTFCAYLSEAGWRVRREVHFCDLVAERGGITLYAEAKGKTSDAGLDVDTLYGQLLRRMPIAKRQLRGSLSLCPKMHGQQRSARQQLCGTSSGSRSML